MAVKEYGPFTKVQLLGIVAILVVVTAAAGIYFVASMTIWSYRGSTSKATVGGRVMKDGKPVANNKVTLVRTVSGKDSGSNDTQTDTNGQFAFNDVTPGTYYVIVGLVLEGRVQCRTTTSGFGILLISATRTATGEPITIAMATNSQNPFKVEAGDQLVIEMVFLTK